MLMRCSSSFGIVMMFGSLLLLEGMCSPAAASPPTSDELILHASPAQMLGIADDLTLRGDTKYALQILELLSKDPDTDVRNEARYRRSTLLRVAGSNSEAAVLLRQILDEKPDAAAVRLQFAQLLDQMGDKEGAFRQLRAAQASGLPTDVARIVDRYSEALRAARPRGATFEIAIAPDSNISKSTNADRLRTVIGDFEIGQDSKAKSGIGLAVTGQAFRRFALGESNQSMLVRLGGSANLYRKTDFNDVALDLAAGPELELGSNRLNLEIGATMRWYGQKPFQRSARVAAVLARPIGARTQLWLKAAASVVDNCVNDLEDGKSYWAQLRLERALNSTSGASLSLTGSRESLRDPGYSTRSWRVGVLGWRDVGRSTITAEFELGRLHADERLSLFPEARGDRLTRLTFGAVFRQLTFVGFAPISRLIIERNRSSIAFYDYSRMRTEIGIVRAF
jgi:hypothetical protein